MMDEHAARTKTKYYILPPAWSRLAELELIVVLFLAVKPMSRWKLFKVKTAPTMPVSYAKRKEPMQLKATRYVALKFPSRLPIVAFR